MPALPAGTSKKITRTKDFLTEDNQQKTKQSDHRGVRTVVLSHSTVQRISRLTPAVIILNGPDSPGAQPS